MYEKLIKLHSLCFPLNHWAEQDFKDLYNMGCEFIIENNAFLIYKTIFDETEIITICVNPKFQNKGIGTKLLKKMEQNFSKQHKFFLEVATNNKKALFLYKSCGFKQISIRKKYYNINGNNIDAFVMVKNL